MPEGWSVRKFHHLVAPFMGQQVVKREGKKPHPADLQSLWLLDNWVHGKKLLLRFDSDEDIGLLFITHCQSPKKKDCKKKMLQTKSCPRAQQAQNF